MLEIQPGKEAAVLVLTRRTNETIVIQLPTGDLVRVTVQQVVGKQVKVGTEAPREVLILRPEIIGRKGQA